MMYELVTYFLQPFLNSAVSFVCSAELLKFFFFPAMADNQALQKGNQPLPKGKGKGKGEGEGVSAWTLWRMEIPYYTVDEQSGWQQWWNRQGRSWGKGTTSATRRQWRAALQAAGGDRDRAWEMAQEEAPEEAL